MNNGLITSQTKQLELNHHALAITNDLFNNDALIFKNLRSRVVTIKSTQHDQTLTVEFPHFNYLGLWAKPGADFVCIEPWFGCADTVDKHVDISKKEDIQHLKTGHVFEAAFFISV